MHQGEVFSIIIHYRIDNAVNNLELACSITDKAGQLITGQRFPELGQSLQRLEGGKALAAASSLKAASSQDYILSMQVHGIVQKNDLHRIIDGCAIRVLEPKESTFGFGVVDLSSNLRN